ncbi:MAG TPA: GNAT family N-acetyltransferase [Candidatus Dormibacteraeota bacterium]|nr:GNAT family N-acetyltransferase [Candidatus Dormibacteraeota bacterium]
MSEISLEPMSQAQFDAWLQRAIVDYAHEHVVDGSWSESEAEEKSRAEHDKLLPQGLATPDNHLWSIVRPSDHAAVGILWVHMRRKPKPHAFVFNVEIFPDFRRRGYAEQAMRKLEEEARRMGAESIRLHVFGHNAAARPLYEKLGFEPTNIVMAKPLN